MILIPPITHSRRAKHRPFLSVGDGGEGPYDVTSCSPASDPDDCRPCDGDRTHPALQLLTPFIPSLHQCRIPETENHLLSEAISIIDGLTGSILDNLSGIDGIKNLHEASNGSGGFHDGVLRSSIAGEEFQERDVARAIRSLT